MQKEEGKEGQNRERETKEGYGSGGKLNRRQDKAI